LAQGTGWFIKSLRFLNVLDDASNVLSPVKLNVWAANLATVSMVAASLFQWLAGHLSGVLDLWAMVGPWLTQAHTVHHFDKRERNIAPTREIAAAVPKPAPQPIIVEAAPQPPGERK